MLLYTVDRLSVQFELWSPIVQGHERWRESQLSATADLASVDYNRSDRSTGQVRFITRPKSRTMGAKRKNVRELTERRCPNEQRARECQSYVGDRAIMMVVNLESSTALLLYKPMVLVTMRPTPSRQVRQIRTERMRIMFQVTYRLHVSCLSAVFVKNS
jgi:hypothetical protein